MNANVKAERVGRSGDAARMSACATLSKTNVNSCDFEALADGERDRFRVWAAANVRYVFR